MKKRISFAFITLVVSIMLCCPAFAEIKPPPNKPTSIELPVKTSK